MTKTRSKKRFTLAQKRLDLIRRAAHVTTPEAIIDSMLDIFNKWKAEQKAKAKQ